MTRLWMIPRRFWDTCHWVQTQKYPQRRKLMVQMLLALIWLRGPKTSGQVAAVWGKHRSSFTRLLRRRELPLDSWVTAEAFAVLRQLGWQPGEVVYAIVDPTFKTRRGKKIANVQKFWSAGPRRYIWAHALVGVILVYRGQRIPLALVPYRTKSWCRQRGVGFRTQGQLAADVIAQLDGPEGLALIVLMDSGLFAAPLLKVIAPRKEQGWYYVSVAQRNRKIVAGAGAEGLIGEHIKELVTTPRAFRQATCRSASGKKNRYWMRREPVSLNNVGEVQLVFSGRKKDQVRQIKPNTVHLSLIPSHTRCRPAMR